MMVLTLLAVAGQGLPPDAPRIPTGNSPSVSAMMPPRTVVMTRSAFARCVRANMTATAAVTSEAAAKQAFARCATERAAMDASVESWIGSPSMPEADRATVRAWYAEQMDTMEHQVAGQIRGTRAQAATAIPAPTASPTPAR